MNDDDVTARLAELDGPPIRIDVDDVIAKGARQVRRRRAMVTATTALATAGVLAGVLVLTNVSAPTVEVATPPPTSATISAAADRKVEEFANYLRERIPQVMRGWVTAENTFGARTRWNYTTNYIVIDNPERGVIAALDVRVFDPAAAKLMPQIPADCQVECRRQSDGSVVVVERSTVARTVLPDALLENLTGGAPPADLPVLGARHFRLNGALVEVWGIAPTEDAEQLKNLDIEQLVTLATDSALSF